MTKSPLWASAGAVAAAVVFASPGQNPPARPNPPLQTAECERRLHQVADMHGVALQPGERLVSDRDGRLRRDLATDELRLHYLLDRRIGGCPVPVVSPMRLEEANRAIGREPGRERGPR